MTLIDKTGCPVKDFWHYPRADGKLEQKPHNVVRLEDWEAYCEQFGQNANGVWIQGNQDVVGVIPLLAHIDVVVIEFPTSRDGRGFTLGRTLRERYDYGGDIRAAGPLLPDQFSMLVQCGYSSLISPSSVPLRRWCEAANALHTARPRTLLDRLTKIQ